MPPPQDTGAPEGTEMVAVTSSPDRVQAPPKMPLKRKLAFAVGYASYCVPSLYSVFLFYYVYTYLMEVADGIMSEETAAAIAFHVFTIASLSVTAVSDWYVNIIGTAPLPQLANNLFADKIYYSLDPVFQSPSSTQQIIIRNARFLTGGLSFATFLIMGQTCVTVMRNFNDATEAEIAATIVFMPLTIVYGRLLLFNGTMKHHAWLLSRLFGGKMLALNAIKRKPIEALELFFQIFSNTFYKMVTFGFITVVILEHHQIGEPNENIGIMVFIACLGGYQTFFTRFIPLTTFIMERNEVNIRDPNYRLLSGPRITQLVVGLTRTAGIIYFVADHGVLVTTCASVPLVLHNIAFAARFSPQEQQTTTSNMLDKLNVATNGASRVIRVGAMVVFIDKLSVFLFANGVLEQPLSRIDSLAAGFASLGVESTNYTFFKDAIKKAMDFWRSQKRREDHFAAENRVPTSKARFLTWTIEQYEPPQPIPVQQPVPAAHAPQ